MVRLWDASTGEPLGSLQGHTRYIHALAFSPKGGILASASADQSIRLWDVQTGKELGVLRGHGQAVWTLAFSPDGSTLASGCKDGSVWLWRAVSKPRQDVQVLRSSGIGYVVAYLPDGKSLAVVNLTGSVSLWDADTMRPKEELMALGTKNLWPAVSPDGRYLAVGGKDGYLRVWDLAERRVATSQPACPQPDGVEPPAESVCVSGFSRDGARLFTINIAEPGCSQVVREVPTWKPVASWSVPRPSGGALSPDPKLGAYGHFDGKLIIWDIDRQRARAEVHHQGEVSAVAFSPDGTILATGSNYGTLMLWDTRTWRALTSPLPGHQLAIHSLAFSPDGTHIATSGGIGNEAVLLWDVATRRQIATLRGDGTNFRGVTFSPDGSTIFVQSMERDTFIWRAPSQAEIDTKERGQK